MERNFTNNKTKITAIIPTLNEGENIEKAIQSVLFTDEIIVIDSFSSDKTIEIAAKYPVKIIQRKFDDFSTQKNYAISYAKNDWILFLDADERITSKLQDEIIENMAKNIEINGYYFKRDNFYKNKKVNFSGWGKDKVLRLFNKNYGKCNDKLVHEEVECSGRTKILKNSLTHYTYLNYQEFQNKIFFYAKLKAKELHLKGSNPYFYHFYLKPAYRYFYHFIYKLGFLDGKIGHIIAIANAKGIYKRYQELKKLNSL